MSNNLFEDNIAAVDELNEREEQLRKNIDTKRHHTSTSYGFYKHKDGTTVIFSMHEKGSKAGESGYDVALVRGNNYLHFETIAEDEYKNGKLNITVGNIDSDKQQNISYPMDDVLCFEKIGEILTEKNPNLAKTYNNYATSNFNDMILETLSFHEFNKKNNETAFMAAFNKWNGGKGI